VTEWLKAVQEGGTLATALLAAWAKELQSRAVAVLQRVEARLVAALAV
jgi:hypothetical protein